MHNRALYALKHKACQEQSTTQPSSTPDVANEDEALKPTSHTEEKPKTGNLLSLLRDPEFHKQAEKYRDWT